MDDTYRFLRRVEHRLQILFDRQTHEMPRDLEAVRTLALRMGYRTGQPAGKSEPARRTGSWPTTAARPSSIAAFSITCCTTPSASDAGTAVDPIVDLVLDPDPAPEFITEVLAPYPFRDRLTAYQNLMALAREDFPFLSQARCRHFLAAIAPRLLEAVSRTPDPDMTLTNLEKVSASLGAKAILWELFNFNPPSLRLYVELCATSQFLSEILINNPGMIDDLVDSLVVDRPLAGSGDQGRAGRAVQGGRGPGADPLELPQQGVGADRHPRHPGPRADPRGDPRAGRRGRGDRDPGGSRPVESARGAVRHAALRRHRPARPLGDPRLWASSAAASSTITATSTWSFSTSPTAIPPAARHRSRNEQFVTEVAQRLLKALGGGSTSGPLYAVDARLRPHGASGPSGADSGRVPTTTLERLDPSLGADGLDAGPGHLRHRRFRPARDRCDSTRC